MRQMANAPRDAVFVAAGQTGYAVRLARHIGRVDLRIVALDYELVRKMVSGTDREIIMDHAIPVTNQPREWETAARVRELKDERARDRDMKKSKGLEYGISFDTVEMPGRVVAVTVALGKTIMRDDSRIRVDLVDHPLYPQLQKYVLENLIGTGKKP